MVGQIEILEVAVERYKNLERVRVEWGPRVAVYGQNGSGKTNLLEAIALALGSRATTWQLADRAVLPLPGSIAITMRTTARQLPIPPVLSLRNGEKIGTATGPASERRLFDSGVFWEALGVERGENWSGALHSGILDARLARLLAAQETAPIIRYRLQAVEGLKEARDCDRGRPDDGSRDPADVTFSRRFARTLCLWKDDVADWLVEMAPELPDSFAPFRRWLAEPTDVRSPVADVLELPPATSAPAHVVWLQAARTDGEAYFDLRDASERAYRPLESLLMELHWMLDSPAADYGDEWELAIEQQTEFILSDLAAEIVRDTVKPVTPELDTTVITDGIGAVTVFSSQHGTEGRLPDLDVFRRLSSGQRAWVDIGLSRAAAEIDRLGTEIGGLLTAFQFPRFTDEASGRRAELVGEIEQAALDDDLEMLELGYLSTHDFKVVLSILRGHFGNPERIVERLGDMLSDLGADVSAQPSLRLAAETGFEEALDRRLVIHMLDEPERHLHPIAQRQVARSLADQHDGVAVVVASHSHYFLGSPGWMHLH